jgi:hypothetical protein
MLSMSKYPQEYIDGCRKAIDAQLSAYRKLAAAGPRKAALDSFEPMFFNDLVIVLDHYFCHRARTIEGKDGNPLNEVRVIANSLMENGGVMTNDKTIPMKPEDSLSKYEAGDEIKLREKDFKLLANGIFAELESKFT